MCGCGSPTLSTPTSPFLIGDVDGIVTRVRATIANSGFKSGESGWVTGTTVPALLAAQILVAV